MPYEAELFDSDESAGSAERRENGEAMQVRQIESSSFHSQFRWA